MIEILSPYEQAVFDVQWATPHLVSLGVVEIPRHEYLRRVAMAVDSPGPW